ncbi:hypothetical protein [Marinilabilia salmonicolor]|uniref:hypothetical protein n=1 Tax=Marinilabilia salmonicolor TaxID=989 RepID=UPI00029A8A62|nr:hypothetical protein [Marinilabilia salmonicolor]
MKNLLLTTTAAVLLIVAGGCTTTGQMASTGVYYDDIYYAPDMTQETREQAFAPVPSIAKEELKQARREEDRQIREYENSSIARQQEDVRDFSEIQEKYATVLSDEQAQEVDTLIYYNDETGYWVDGFDGSSMDRDYAERLIRFHGPFNRIPYYSPLYNQFVYFNDPDWNVYVDGNYAYAFPTWSNRWYDTYRFNRWSSPWSMSFGYSSWGYPSYNSWYGYGYYDPFYDPYYYGWGYHHRPYYHRSYYSYWHQPYYNHGYYSHNSKKDYRNVERGIKPSMGTNTRYSNTSSGGAYTPLKRTGSTGEERVVRTTDSGTRIIRNSNGSTTVTNPDRNTQRVIRGTATLKSDGQNTQDRSVTRYRSTGASSGTVQSRTRRSSAPTYSQPENASKPSYNRTSTYTRPTGTNTRTRTESSLKAGSSTQQRSVSTPTRTYNSGSSTQQRSNVQRSSYTPAQRSSSSNSSYTPSRSSSSSSRSSYSGSSSTSSGSRSSSGSSSGSTVRSGRR